MTSSRALTMALALPALIGVAALGTGVSRRFFDYDEIYHAHATWLIAHGFRPFHDFQASHSPPMWYALAAAWRIVPELPASLIALRWVGAAGTLLSVAAMTASFAAVRREVPAVWWAVGIFVIAFDRNIVDYALEFRPDAWATAALFGAFLLLLRGRPAATLPRYAVFACLATLAIVASPKFVLLPVIFGVLDLATRAYQRDGFARALCGYACGVSVALAASLIFLRTVRIDPHLAFDMAIRYQWAVVSGSGFGRGLLDAVMTHWVLLLIVALGVLAWVAHLTHLRRRPTTYELAVVLFLLGQLVLVDRPYKQYYAPWFLVAAGFVPFLGVLVSRAHRRVEPWTLAAAALLASWTSLTTLQAYAADDKAGEMRAFYETLLHLSPADGPVVAYPPLHPVFRRDVFYSWSRSTDPAGNGTDAIMARLAVPDYSRRFDRPFYREEIAARPPALVVAPIDANWGYEPKQWAVVREYLATHQDEYVLVDRGLPAPVWVRTNRLDPARLDQLIGAPR